MQIIAYSLICLQLIIIVIILRQVELFNWEL